MKDIQPNHLHRITQTVQFFQNEGIFIFILNSQKIRSCRLNTKQIFKQFLKLKINIAF